MVSCARGGTTGDGEAAGAQLGRLIVSAVERRDGKDNTCVAVSETWPQWKRDNGTALAEKIRTNAGGTVLTLEYSKGWSFDLGEARFCVMNSGGLNDGGRTGTASFTGSAVSDRVTAMLTNCCPSTNPVHWLVPISVIT